MVEIQIGIGQAGFRAFHQHSVQLAQSQQRLKYLALIGHLILSGKEQRCTAVAGQHIFHLSKDTGKDVVTDIGGNYRNGTVRRGSFRFPAGNMSSQYGYTAGGNGGARDLLTADVGTTALPFLDKPVPC